MAYAFPTSSFVLDIVGDNTGEKFTGNFEFKQRLSWRDRIQKDTMRRSIIGDKPEGASQDVVMRAEMLAQLSVSVVDAPKFWKESNGGLDLYDDNIAIKLYEAVMEMLEKTSLDISAKGEEAKAELKKGKRAKEE